MSSSERDDSTPRERLEASLKTPYPADGDIWSAFLDAMAAEFKELEAARQEVMAAKFVDTAPVGALGRLAELFEVERRTDEPVPEFRARVKVALRSQIAGGTLVEIKDMMVVLLNISREDISLIEPDDEIATLEPRIPANSIGQAQVRPRVLNDLLDDVSAAGVSAEANFLAEPVSIRLATYSTSVAEPTQAPAAPLSFATTASGSRTLSSVGLSSSEMESLSYSGWQLSADDLGFWSSGAATPGLIPAATAVRKKSTSPAATVDLNPQNTEYATNRQSVTASPNLTVGDTVHSVHSTVGLSASELNPLSAAGAWTLSNA